MQNPTHYKGKEIVGYAIKRYPDGKSVTRYILEDGTEAIFNAAGKTVAWPDA